MRIHLNPNPLHANGVFDAALPIDHKRTRQHVQNFKVNRIDYGTG